MIKNLLTFIKHDFVSQVFLLNITLTLIYACSLFDEVSNLTTSLCVLGLIFSGFSSNKLYKSKVTVRYELMLLLPLFIFAVCLTFGLIHKYNEVGSLSQLMTYTSLSRLIDFAFCVALVYGVFLGIMGFSCSFSVKEHFNEAASNIRILTGNNPEFVHYGITRYNKTFFTSKSFVFDGDGLIRQKSVISYQSLYNYIKAQNIHFNALKDDDFLLIEMVQI